jgi:cytochrome c nitrite reductase small subunit
MKWLAGLSPPLVAVSALLGLLGGAGTYTVVYSESTAYLSNDPRACVNCHIMRDHYDGWQKASHHGFATCNDCHVPEGFVRKYASKAENGFWHSKGFTLQDFPEPIRIRPHNREVVNSNCRRCHESLVREIHPGDLNCVRCHDQVGHGPTR